MKLMACPGKVFASGSILEEILCYEHTMLENYGPSAGWSGVLEKVTRLKQGELLI
jgi:hypothetical protein